jgi:hypothetical protein
VSDDYKKARDEAAKAYYLNALALSNHPNDLYSFADGADFGKAYAEQEIARLKAALNSAYAAMIYAYEDRTDQYYLNVAEELERILKG